MTQRWSEQQLEDVEQRIDAEPSDDFLVLLGILEEHLSDFDRGRDLRGRDWSGVSFRACNLYGCDFSSARLIGCDFTNARISGARFDQAEIDVGKPGPILPDDPDKTNGPFRTSLRRAADWREYRYLARAEDQERAKSDRPRRPLSDDHLPTGAVWQDAPYAPEMVKVPAGTFMMGSSPEEIEALKKETSDDWPDREGPQHEVTIPQPFAVSRFPVTFDEWDAAVAAGGVKHQPDDEGWGRGQRPVINVAWDDITKEYLPWLNRITGQTYRLLSDAEWEYVARAGTTGPFSFDGQITTNKANYDGNYTFQDSPKGEYRKQTVEVDAPSFPANPWGLFHVHGNVWEWCEDNWHEDYQGDPPDDGSVWQGGDRSLRVVRGGGWYSYPHSLRSAYRYRVHPDVRIGNLGFRLARTLLR